MSGNRVLVVDDEPQIHRFLRPALTACGYDVLGAETGGEALQLIATKAPDAVVLDLGLPDMDGKEVLRRARQFSKIPIIILSARDRESEKIAALDAGADDYVEKPFGIGELMARLRAALRHAAADAHEQRQIKSGRLCIDLDKRSVTRDGVTVKLTRKEYDILAILVSRPGHLITHRHMLTAVWGRSYNDDMQYLRVYIGRLRAKIEEDPASPRLILTETGVGYRFAHPDP
ncbi:response regulator [Methylocapsa palsarum]|uniref:Two-component system, OmpR family, KDP operon response regulator KdpE n=1 Tax=Methylocapsa palsarum TaxID=1612308 RepID=A0A1I4AWD3_9HYPH|nr:response regulator [Methylocapsa palsarum]SFK60734.1 two-component system, OmpR family, KDP operon response regulator KdpE [Methylocapsa palsarum]